MPDYGLDEHAMFEPMEEHLSKNGYEIVEINTGNSAGADIIASKNGRDLVIEMKGHTKALTTDIRTCVGQICGQMEEGGDEYALALSESYRNYIRDYFFALKKLGVRVFIVSEEEVVAWERED